MASKIKSSTWPGGLSGLVNSPRFGKIFKVLLIALMLAAAGYGAYTLISQRFSSASSSTYYYHTKGIGHGIGRVANGLDGKSKDWLASYGGNINQFAWYGPYKNLPGGKQYLACFEYANGGDPKRPPGAFFEVTSDVGRKIIRQEKVTAKFQAGKKSTSYDRTCLPFYLKKQAYAIELRIRPFTGTLLIKSTQIRTIPPSQATGMLRAHDNTSVLLGYGYDPVPATGDNSTLR